MTDLRYDIIRALYKQGVFRGVDSATAAADAVLEAIGVDDPDIPND